MKTGDVFYEKDLGVTIFIEKLDEYVLKFQVFDVVSFSDIGVPEYQSKVDDRLLTEKHEEAELMLSGFIKWDGCSHFYFGPDNDEFRGYLHLCGFHEITKLSKVVLYLFVLASRSVEMFDCKVADYE